MLTITNFNLMRTFVCLLFLSISTTLYAQVVQDFSLTNVADGKVISLNSYPSCSGIVVIFTSNACPYDGYYTERIRGLVEGYQGKIQFLLINSYTEDAETEDKMKSAYSGWKIPAPYLSDKDQKAMECLSAKKSPEALLLKPGNAGYTIVYRGPIDDNPQLASAVTSLYLKKSIDQLLGGQPIDQTALRFAGCTIRRK